MTISEAEQEYFISWANELLDTEALSKREPHGDEGVVYQLQCSTGKYFLKLKANTDFSSERERLEWLKDKLSVPHVIGSTQSENVGALLLTAIEGKNLAALSKEWQVEKVIDELVRVLRLFHAADPAGWPFEALEPGMVLVHGDACLPNFIFSDQGFSGYVDLGEAALAYPETDLRAAVWSLERNLGPGHGLTFLKNYGFPEATEEKVAQLLLEYEDYKNAWLTSLK